VCLSLIDLYAGGRLYVVDKRMESNSVIVAEGADHPALLADSLYALDVHWISDTPRQLQVSSIPSCLSSSRLHPLTQRCVGQTGQSLECEYQVGHLRAPARCQVELADASVCEAANEGTISVQLYHVRFIDRPHWYAGAHAILPRERHGRVFNRA
jgi:hypothetical protein